MDIDDRSLSRLPVRNSFVPFVRKLVLGDQEFNFEIKRVQNID